MTGYTLQYTAEVDVTRKAAGESAVQKVFDAVMARPLELGTELHDKTRVYHANLGVTVKYVVLEERRLVLVFDLTV